MQNYSVKFASPILFKEVITLWIPRMYSEWGTSVRKGFLLLLRKAIYPNCRIQEKSLNLTIIAFNKGLSNLAIDTTKPI